MVFATNQCFQWVGGWKCCWRMLIDGLNDGRTMRRLYGCCRRAGIQRRRKKTERMNPFSEQISVMEVLAELFYNGLVDSGAIFNQRNVPFSQQSTSFDAAQRAGDGAAKKNSWLTSFLVIYLQQLERRHQNRISKWQNQDEIWAKQQQSIRKKTTISPLLFRVDENKRISLFNIV